MIPKIETQRLLLRPFELGDASRVQELAGDPEVSAMTSNVPHPYQDGMAESWIGTHEKSAAEGTGYTWAIAEREGELIGAISLMGVVTGHKAELGFWLGRCAWGKGFMTEAARAVVEFAFRELELIRVHSSHYGANRASGRVLEKLSMQYEGCQRNHFLKNGKLYDRLLYGLQVEDWKHLGRESSE